jgi:hypothetical protein
MNEFSQKKQDTPATVKKGLGIGEFREKIKF